MSEKGKSFQTIGEVSVNYINYIDDPLPPKSIKTGFTDFDYASNGVQLGRSLLLLQGRAWGKRHLLLI